MRWISRNRRGLWLAAAVVWMALIFGFSQQKAEQSSEVSGTITYRMAEGISEAFELDWKEETLLAYAEEWQHPVRKAAHMTEYAIFACILLGNMMQYPKTRGKAYLWAWIGAAAYAGTDEFHQLFIEGRSGEFKDVCIDSSGALIGLLAAWILLMVWNRVVRKR